MRRVVLNAQELEKHARRTMSELDLAEYPLLAETKRVQEVGETDGKNTSTIRRAYCMHENRLVLEFSKCSQSQELATFKTSRCRSESFHIIGVDSTQPSSATEEQHNLHRIQSRFETPLLSTDSTSERSGDFATILPNETKFFHQRNISVQKIFSYSCITRCTAAGLAPVCFPLS